VTSVGVVVFDGGESGGESAIAVIGPSTGTGAHKYRVTVPVSPPLTAAAMTGGLSGDGLGSTGG